MRVSLPHRQHPQKRLHLRVSGGFCHPLLRWQQDRLRHRPAPCYSSLHWPLSRAPCLSLLSVNEYSRPTLLPHSDTSFGSGLECWRHHPLVQRIIICWLFSALCDTLNFRSNLYITSSHAQQLRWGFTCRDLNINYMQIKDIMTYEWIWRLRKCVSMVRPGWGSNNNNRLGS